jgi:dolichol-phosphate mannosyltransferase
LLSTDSHEAPRVGVVVPVRNEEGNIGPLVAEIEQALSGTPFEIIVVNDGSTDETPVVLSELQRGRGHLRVITHAESCGQSAAVRTGVRASRAPLIATLDGDGQNDPAFLPAMFDKLRESGAGLVQGERQGRRDTGFKRFQSRTANAVRRRVLGDGTRDTGCGLKVFPREVYLALPYFDALHRFMPALVQREGHAVVPHPVKDRARLSGRSNYGFFDRLWVGILDLIGVWWLIRRRRRVPRIVETA